MLATSQFGHKKMTFVPNGFCDELSRGYVVDHIFSIDGSIQNFSTNTQQNLKQSIRNGCGKIFAIALYSGVSMLTVNRIVSVDQKSDNLLPLNRDDCPRAAVSNDFMSFVQHQHLFSAPFFRLDVFDHSLQSTVPIPIDFSEDKGRLGRGREGSIFSATIHSDQHSFDGFQGPFALKRIKDGNSAIRELNTLSKLAPTQHPHIAKILAGFGYQNDTYLIAELANEDLRTFMSQPGMR